MTDDDHRPLTEWLDRLRSQPGDGDAAWMRCDQPPLTEIELSDYCRGDFPPETDHWGYYAR